MYKIVKNGYNWKIVDHDQTTIQHFYNEKQANQYIKRISEPRFIVKKTTLTFT
jgi:hypothetical protein